ncbi:MAG: hypothetical protein ABW032_11220 [Burkholderiaceae bacterium]
MRRSFLLHTVAAACALFGASAAWAADPVDANADHADRRAQAQQRLLAKLDTDGNGVVSRDEYRAWADARFDALDVDGNGRVDADEVSRSTATAERVRDHADRFIARYGTDGSGQVTKSDFEAKALARFDRLANGADSLTADQLTARGHGHHRKSAEGG